MARTPLAARISIDPAFSDGERGGHSLEAAEFQSPIDLTARTPTHIRFAELEQNQLVGHPAAGRLNRNLESLSNQRLTTGDQAELISPLQSEISVMRRIPPVGEILSRQSG